MSNRYIDLGAIARSSHTLTHPSSKHIKSHLQRPTNEKEQKRKNRIEDISAEPKQKRANNAFRLRLKQMQDAKNYRNEADRLHSMIHEGRVAGNHRHVYASRLIVLRRHLVHLQPMIAEHGHYHHV